MKPSEPNNKKWIQGIAIILPILFVSGGWMLWRAKHPTLSQAPQNLGASNNSSSPSQNLDSTNINTGVVEQGSQSSGVTSAPNAKSGALGKSESSQNKDGSSNSAQQNSGQFASNELGTGSNLKPSGSTETKMAMTPEVMTDGCFTLTFNHKSLATHASDDECSHHRNLIKLPRTDVTASSVCIRVNGTPVRHEAISGKAGEFVIGAVAGPKDVVTARFCVGKSKCNEGCPYPKQEAAKKDEFLEAISGGSNEDSEIAQWEASDAQKNNEVNQALDGDLKKAVEEHELASQRTAAGNSKLEIFKDWIGGQMAVTCGTRQAGEPSRSTASVQVANSSAVQKPIRKQ
jgi:hypothetical protein